MRSKKERSSKKQSQSTAAGDYPLGCCSVSDEKPTEQSYEVAENDGKRHIAAVIRAQGEEVVKDLSFKDEREYICR